MNKEENFLNNLWDGNIFPQEELLNTKNEEINNLKNEICRLEKQGKKEEKNNLLSIFNSHPLIVNFITCLYKSLHCFFSL